MESSLIQPCDCKGGLKYIHFKCLQQWLLSRTSYLKKSISPSACSYFLKTAIQCEICKKQLPNKIKQKNKIYDLFSFLRSDYKKYIIFESLLTDHEKRNNPQTRNFYTINLQDRTEYNIGRGHESDLRLNDISISRIHCTLNIKENSIFISDHISKFGTLIFIYNPKLPILKHTELPIQIGRSLIYFSVNKLFSLTNCIFFCVKKKQDNTYDDTNYEELNHIKISNIEVLAHSISNSDNSETEDSRLNTKISLCKKANIIEKKDFIYEIKSSNLKKEENPINKVQLNEVNIDINSIRLEPVVETIDDKIIIVKNEEENANLINNNFQSNYLQEKNFYDSAKTEEFLIAKNHPPIEKSSFGKKRKKKNNSASSINFIEKEKIIKRQKSSKLERKNNKNENSIIKMNENLRIVTSKLKESEDPFSNLDQLSPILKINKKFKSNKRNEEINHNVEYIKENSSKSKSLSLNEIKQFDHSKRHSNLCISEKTIPLNLENNQEFNLQEQKEIKEIHDENIENVIACDILDKDPVKIDKSPEEIYTEEKKEFEKVNFDDYSKVHNDLINNEKYLNDIVKI